MLPNDEFAERTVRFAEPTSHYAMAIAPDGRFLAADESGTVSSADEVSDAAMWRHTGTRLEHAVHPVAVPVTEARAEFRNTRFAITRGPERLPSEYLAHLDTHGWVCLAAILPPTITDALQRIACTDGYATRAPDRTRRQICQDGALAKAAVEPVSVWLARRYMQTNDIRLAHAPGIGVMTPDDGERTVQGWHSDYPYHWGIHAEGKVPTPSGATVMGVQRIVCVSEFTKFRGATAFKLGSHARDAGPPAEWGVASDVYRPDYRAANGLPYNGPDADVIEAPPGSMILFDTRTWHRAGINRSRENRAAILMDMTPAYIVPYSDTTADYRALVGSDAYDELNDREKREFERLMIHRFLGPAGARGVIGTDAELTRDIPPRPTRRYASGSDP